MHRTHGGEQRTLQRREGNADVKGNEGQMTGVTVERREKISLKRCSSSHLLSAFRPDVLPYPLKC